MSGFVVPGMALPPFSLILSLSLLLLSVFSAHLYKYAAGCCCTSEEPGVSLPCQRKRERKKNKADVFILKE